MCASQDVSPWCLAESTFSFSHHYPHGPAPVMVVRAIHRDYAIQTSESHPLLDLERTCFSFHYLRDNNDQNNSCRTLTHRSGYAGRDFHPNTEHSKPYLQLLLPHSSLPSFIMRPLVPLLYSPSTEACCYCAGKWPVCSCP